MKKKIQMDKKSKNIYAVWIKKNLKKKDNNI